MLKRTKLITCFLAVLFIAIAFSCTTKKEPFSEYFLSNQWRADYGKEGAPVVDSTNYKMYVSAIREDGILSAVGDTGIINASRDTIYFSEVPSAWVLIKKIENK